MMKMFESGTRVKISAKEKQKQVQEPALLRVPGKVIRDCEVEWHQSNVQKSAGLTPEQIRIIKREMKWKGFDSIKVEQVKARMSYRTCAQIVKDLDGRPGYSERTVKGLHAALSKAGVGVK
jgi:ATP-dependent 26S proteasome regulatory subunit